MHIVACVKRVPDPEAPWVQFSIAADGQSVSPLDGMRWVMSPFDEQAVEAALRLRDVNPDVRITALTVGGEASRAVLKHALAMGADDGVLVCDAALEAGDAWVTAHAIAAAVRALGDPPLVLLGRQSADWDAGIVGPGLAELLERPLASHACDIRAGEGGLRVERVVEEGTDAVSLPLPAVVTVSNELGAARAPSLRETMRAARKPVQVWGCVDLRMQAPDLAPREQTLKLYTPKREQACEFIAGDTPREAAEALAATLRAAGLV